MKRVAFTHTEKKEKKNGRWSHRLKGLKSKCERNGP